MTQAALGEIDRAYQNRFAKELLEALFRVSMVDQGNGQRTAVVRSYEAIESMLTMIAMLSATSTETTTPAKTRRLCDELSRKIHKRIVEAQKQPMPFDTIVPGALNA